MSDPLRCPTCKELRVRKSDPYFPFCSERCRLVDLGRWLNEEYRVAGPATSDERDDDEPKDGPDR